MKHFCLSLIFSIFSIVSFSQTCTLTGTGTVNWAGNGSGTSCFEGGVAFGKTTVVIPAGLTVNFTGTWTGTTIVVNGTLNISGNVTINSSIHVGNGGYLYIPGKLSLGTATGCGYTLIIYSGGVVDTSNSASDRLSICGNEIIKGGGGGCNPSYPMGAPPYCDGPGIPFTGPTGVDEGGYNGALPVRLQYFELSMADEVVNLRWATTMEENFFKFIIQRSGDGLSFQDIGEVKGQGFDTEDIVSKYTFQDEVPFTGYNYYRLKAVDLDESFEYFGVKAIKVNSAKKMGVYPNPSSGEVISLRTNFTPQESDRIVLTDQMGSEVFSAYAHTVGNDIAFASRLRPGIYMLRYVSDDFEEISRIVIRN